MSHESSLTATPPVAAEPINADACPRCRQPLIDPAGLGWCKACGYCRSLETEQNHQLLGAAPAPTRGEALAGAARQIPLWFWVLLAGIGVLGGMSLAVGRLLPAGSSFPRALWTTVQMVLGLFLILA